MGGSLRIAWLGAGPGAREAGGAPGVALELLDGLAAKGHRIECFFPGTGYELPARLARHDNLTFNWGTSSWSWDRWYSRTRLGVFVTGLLSRALSSVRLRRRVTERHRAEPFDVIFQFSSIETLGMPASLRGKVPLVIHPATHIAGELRSMLSEWRLGLRCQPPYTLAVAALVMAVRVLVQRRMIRRAQMVICISSVFRDHLVGDYGIDPARTVVIPNPLWVARFADADAARPLGDPPQVLVVGRVSARKGVEDVVAVAGELARRRPQARLKLIGGPSLWSDYTKLLDDLPAQNAERCGSVSAGEVAQALARADVLLQASKYEPFALTVAEALASCVPVVATTEVGAIEEVDRSVAAVVAPGDVAALTEAIEDTLDRLSADAPAIRSHARAEAQRLFASEKVCDEIAAALATLR